jgi:hypothetical protein
MGAMFSPFIIAAGQPWIMICPSFLAALLCVLSFCMNQPGQFLPEVAALSENATWMQLENITHVIDESLVNPVPGHSTSFFVTFYERKMRVRRPRLNDSNVDPSLITTFMQMSKRNQALHAGAADQSYSRVIKNWDIKNDKSYQAGTDKRSKEETFNWCPGTNQCDDSFVRS